MELYDLCRLCLSSSGFYSNIFTDSLSDQRIYHVINSFCDISVSLHDGLPEYICVDCLKTIEKFCSFRMQAKHGKEALILMRRKNQILHSLCDNEASKMHHSRVSLRESLEIEKELQSEAQVLEKSVCTSGNSDSKSVDTFAESLSNKIESGENGGSEGSPFHLNRLDDLPGIPDDMYDKDKNCYICRFCGKSKKRVYSIKKHMLSHTNRRPYQCSVCENSYKSEEARRHHELRHLQKDSSEGISHLYPCLTCGRRFQSKIAVRRHHRGIHELQFRCNLCRQKFARKDTLAHHLLNHKMDKPHKCNLCGKDFATKYSLKFHMSCHSDEKPFACGKCGFRSKYKSNMKMHEMSHVRREMMMQMM